MKTVYEMMDLDAIVGVGRSYAALAKDEALALFGTLSRYAAHVKVWRAARMVQTCEVEARQDGDLDWNLGACTCPLQRLTDAKGRLMFGNPCDVGVDGDDVWSRAGNVHAYCGGHSSPLKVGGRAMARVGEAMGGCTCKGHPMDTLTGAVNAMRARLADVALCDSTWADLSAAEKGAEKAKDGRSNGRSRMHYAGDVLGGKGGGPVERIETLASDRREALARLESTPLPERVSHSCSRERAPLETWATYFGRTGLNCPRCASDRVRQDEALMDLRALSSDHGYSVPEGRWIRGDRVSAKGRNPALSTGQGGGRVAGLSA